MHIWKAYFDKGTEDQCLQIKNVNLSPYFNEKKVRFILNTNDEI